MNKDENGVEPTRFFIDRNNTLYVTDTENYRIYQWRENSINATRIISDDLLLPYSLFVTITGDMYIEYGLDGQISKWTSNTNIGETVATFCDSCFHIFIDINDVLYCSMSHRNQVATKPLHGNSNIITIVAGVRTYGSMAHMLHGPEGIFVDINLDLYVADCGNNRVQLFHPGQLNGSTVAGTSDTIMLSCPTAVILDANNYLYIVDHYNRRIVGSGYYGFRCLIGCGRATKSIVNRQFHALTIAFDSYGNIYANDKANECIQKFVLSTNTCSK